MGKKLSIEDINIKISKLGFQLENFQDNKYLGVGSICTFKCKNNHYFQRKLNFVLYSKWNVYCPECKVSIIEGQKSNSFNKLKNQLSEIEIELISNTNDIYDIKCKCGTIFKIKTRSIRRDQRKICCKNCDNKHIHYNEAVLRFEELNCPLIIDKNSFECGVKKCKMFCKKCNQEYNRNYCDIVKRLTVNQNKTLYLKCGCYKNDLCGKKFGELTVLSNDRKNTKKGFLEQCICSCGQIVYAYRSELLNNRRKLCDNNHYTRILNIEIKQFLSKQNIEMLTPFKGARRFVKLKCNCGKSFELTGNNLSKKLKANQVVSCHNMVNGCMTSTKAIQLHKLITDFGVHNFKSKKCGFIDIAFVYKGRKIAIEYDEWFWHRKNLARDKRKTKKLIENGWLVIRILASNDLPAIGSVWDAINRLISTNRKSVSIKSKNWKGYD